MNLLATDTIVDNKQGIADDRDQRRLVVDHLPYYFHVHLNEPCNQKCIMCVPTGQHGKSVLPFEKFLAFFEQIKPFAEHITLIGGEPLMYPNINEVLDLLAEHPIAVTINTNATMLNDRVVPRLLSLHELNLKCSIDAATSMTYLRIRGRNHFQRVTSQLMRFAELSRDLPQIHLVPIFVVMQENLSEVVPFLKFAKQLSPLRVEFHPVRHVSEWVVTNGTGWVFDGSQQICEANRDDYNAAMRQAAEVCASEGIDCEIHIL
jgi:molybdenum cofactor biosynthesis enzyme MoaA